MIDRIEVRFAVPVELTDEENRTIFEFVDRIARRHQEPGRVHWASGCGSKPTFSKQDIGMVPLDMIGDRERGEPEWDDSILYIETCEREDYNAVPDRKETTDGRK